ncbi:MAG TPA: carboxymuconolactone decarboxylase family protein [Amaricoccus sp.]|uniref:carboxymuconolactone decarboxylase family protein n=1 Tax=Amaricoccus sp. TaxID=1872485 RepID=UPI002BDECA35|nr:carboxymuconolactone decarboxylase family protein [Amaricoccus sp.]HPG23662.1 carboxymuconolactone decarboxylase family protein [Amaricoccus sp.]HRW15152.1 carboxymuconolactone decarboxylase family protein [Amaricoccus sp.]
MKVFVAIALPLMLAAPVIAQETSADDIRKEAAETFGAALPEIENYPDSMLGGAWAWMNDVEDGEGALDTKTMQLIGLAVAAQIPCQYCTHYHRAAALASGATEQEIAEAAAMAGYVRNWSAVLYGTGADLETYKTMVDGIFAGQ